MSRLRVLDACPGAGEGDDEPEVRFNPAAAHPVPGWKSLSKTALRAAVDKHMAKLQRTLDADNAQVMTKLQRPLVVAYGLGVDSTAMLVGMAAQKVRPDLIVFANTGSEKPETYDYFPVMQKWLKKVGFPPITVVRAYPKTGPNAEKAHAKDKAAIVTVTDHAGVQRTIKHVPVGTEYSSLGEHCVLYRTLPGVAYNDGSCAQKFKIDPQDSFVKTWAPAQAAWAKGQRVTKFIGYDGGKADAKRGLKIPKRDDKFWATWEGGDPFAPFITTSLEAYSYVHPLRLWGWEREDCVREIEAAGLPVPMKSACYSP